MGEGKGRENKSSRQTGEMGYRGNNESDYNVKCPQVQEVNK